MNCARAFPQFGINYCAFQFAKHNICNNVNEVRKDLKNKIAEVQKVANKNDNEIISIGTHPFARWKDQSVTNTNRYLDFLEKFHPFFIEELSMELSAIHSDAEKKYLRSMKELNEAELFSFLAELKNENNSFLNELTLLVYECYYQHQTVLGILKMNARAPFPEGHKVMKGDLKLLDPVIKKGRNYMEV